MEALPFNASTGVPVSSLLLRQTLVLARPTLLTLPKALWLPMVTSKALGFPHYLPLQLSSILHNKGKPVPHR